MNTVMLTIISIVSIFDLVLSHIHRETLLEMEQNPVGTLLIQTGGVNLLIGVKIVGTVIAVIACGFLCKTKYRPTVFVVTVFQVLLFFYLNFDIGMGGSDIHAKTDKFPITRCVEFLFFKDL